MLKVITNQFSSKGFMIEGTFITDPRECLSQGSLSEYQIFVVREPRTVKRAYSSLKLIDAIKFLSQ
jgi:hypothetical protein